MNREKAEKHINFLTDIIDQTSGQLYIYRKGKNAKIRAEADRKIESAVAYAERYLRDNNDLFNFMVSHVQCNPEHLEYPDFYHLEKDSRMFREALNELLQNLE